jgi:hypothetical protein
MPPTFHPFPRLPAELHAHVWVLALTNSYAVLKSPNRIIEFRDYSTELEEVALNISSSYAAVFHVNHEARYKAAKLDGGEWVTVCRVLKTPEKTPALTTPHHTNVACLQIHARFDGEKETGHTTTFTLYINHSRDTISLSERFVPIDAEVLSQHACAQPEELRLKLFRALLPNSTVPKIQRLLLAANSKPHNNTYWRGTGLSAFPSLTYFHAFSPPQDYIAVLRQAVQKYVHKLWEKKEMPSLVFTLGAGKAALWELEEYEELRQVERELEDMMEEEAPEEARRQALVNVRRLLGGSGGL